MSEQYESVELIGDRTVQFLAVSVLVAALTAALAQVTVPYPLSPAPFTLQTVGVYLAGLLLGPVWGGFSLLLYVLVGVAGAPVFAGGGSGLGAVLGPTGGYIVSFPVAAALIGGLVHRRGRPRRLDEVSIPLQVGGLLAGLVVVYAVGSVWMSVATGLPLGRAVFVGGAVFLPGDAAKAVAVMALVTGGHLAQSRDLTG